MTFTAPDIDYAGLSPIIALTTGLVVVLLAGLVGRAQRRLVSLLSFITLGAAAGLAIWQFGESKDLVAGALRVDDLGLVATLIAIASAAFVIPLSWREEAADDAPGPAGHGEFQALLIASVLGMAMLAMSQNLITFFVGLELLSIPLYVLCGSALRRRQSLESGLKYLIIGSLGSATLLYGMAFIYGGSGSTDFAGIRDGIGSSLAEDPLILIGIALMATGLAFKISIAPFHQWTPDVYQGAPTPVTAFMAVATKAAAFAVFARFFEIALGPAVGDWQPALAALAAVSIIVGNVGALTQSSLKRLLGYSSVAQAGYMLVGIVAANAAGVQALFFYLAAYAFMNLAAFAVITIRERETGFGDDIRSVQGLGRERPGIGLAADDRDARARRPAGDRGVHRQAVPDRGGGGRRLHVARRDDRRGDDDLTRVLPPRDRGRLDAARLSRRPDPRDRPPGAAGDGRGLARGRDATTSPGLRWSVARAASAASAAP